MRGKVHHAAQLFIEKEEWQKIPSSNHKSRAPLKALRRRPVHEIHVEDLSVGEALTGESDCLRVAIKADEASIADTQRRKDATSATAELNDGAASRLGERAPKRTVLLSARVEVTLVVKESTPSCADQRPCSQRIVSPAAFRFASELITSRAARFAIIAVDSAQSYGGETSKMSIPAIGTRAAI